MSPADRSAADIFSAKGLVRWCLTRVWPRLIVAGIIALVFVREWAVLGVIFAVFVLMSFTDVMRYERAWSSHKFLRAKFGSRYDSVLNEKMEAHGLPALISRGWADLEVAFKAENG